MSAEARGLSPVAEPDPADAYVVTIEYDATVSRFFGRWTAKITRKADRYPVASKYALFTRKRAEKAALRHIRRMPGARSYSFTVTRQEIGS